MIVDIAFAVVPTILGLGAAGLIGSGIINTAKEVRNSISLLRTVGPMIQMGGMAGKGLNIGRKKSAEWLKQRDSKFWRGVGHFFTPIQWYKSRRKGGGGNPPTPPDTK
jgi:hypothetical protein